MIIDQLPLLEGDILDDDEFPIERGVTTYKTELSAIADAVNSRLTKDDSPTEDSTNPITSGAVYEALLGVGSGSGSTNLLYNWYFMGTGSQAGNYTFPINTKGQSSYAPPVGSADYGIDAWKQNVKTSITLDNTGLLITNTDSYGYADIHQNPAMRASQLVGKTITATALFTDAENACIEIMCGLDSVFDGESITGSGMSTVTAVVPNDATYVNCLIKVVGANASARVLAAKVEIGPEQTLAERVLGVWKLKEVPDYAREKYACQMLAETDVSAYVTVGKDIGTTEASCVVTNGCGVVNLRTYDASTPLSILSDDAVFTLPTTARPRTPVTLLAVCATTNYNATEFAFVTIGTDGKINVPAGTYYQIWICGSYPVK